MHRVAITVSMVLRTVTPSAQCTKILRRLNRDLLSAQLYHGQRRQHFPGRFEVPFAGEALQDLRQNQVANCQRLLAEQPIEISVCRVTVPLK